VLTSRRVIVRENDYVATARIFLASRREAIARASKGESESALSGNGLNILFAFGPKERPRSLFGIEWVRVECVKAADERPFFESLRLTQLPSGNLAIENAIPIERAGVASANNLDADGAGSDFIDMPAQFIRPPWWSDLSADNEAGLILTVRRRPRWESLGVSQDLCRCHNGGRLLGRWQVVDLSRSGRVRDAKEIANRHCRIERLGPVKVRKQVDHIAAGFGGGEITPNAGSYIDAEASGGCIVARRVSRNPLVAHALALGQPPGNKRLYRPDRCRFDCGEVHVSGGVADERI
jgi:hypothetical protein